MSISLQVVGNIQAGQGGGRLRSLGGSSGVARAASSIASSFASVAADLKTLEREREQLDRFQALQDLEDISFNIQTELTDVQRSTVPGATDVLERATSVFDPKASEYLAKVPPRLRPEMAERINRIRTQLASKMRQFDLAQKDEFYKTHVNEKINSELPALADRPNGIEEARLRVFQEIDETPLPALEKDKLKREASINLGEVAYKRYVLDQETGLARGVDHGVAPVRDEQGFWQVPGLKYALHGKIRSLPLTRGYVQKVVGTVQNIDPNLNVVITSGGQAQKGSGGPRTGSTRHDVHDHGQADTADLVLEHSGRRIKPSENKALYAKVIKDLAAQGFTGIGHYSWGIHVGTGKPAFWGPDKTGKTADPALRAAYEAGRSRREGGLDFDPVFANIPFERRVRLRAQAKIEANKINENKLRIVSQGLADDLMARHGTNFAAARAEARVNTSNEVRDMLIKRIDARRNEIAADRAFNKEEQDELDLLSWQEKADAIYDNSGSKQEAWAATSQLKGKERKEVQRILKQQFEDDARVASLDLVADATELHDKIISSTNDEQEALSAADRIPDATKRDAAKKLIRQTYADKTRVRTELATRESQEIFDALEGEGLTYLQQLAKARETTTGAVRKQLLQLIDAQEQRQRTADKERTRSVESQIYQRMLEGENLNTILTELSLEDQDAITSNRQAMDGLLRAQDTINRGALFARTSDGKTLKNLQLMNIEDMSKVDPENLRLRLTEREYTKAISLIKGAQDKLQANAEAQAIYDIGYRELKKVYPTRTRNKKEVIDFTAEQQRAAESEMTAFIAGVIAEGRKPTRAEIREFAAKMATEIEADPEGINPFGFRPDVGGFEGLALERSTMSPQQRSVAKADFDSIPSTWLRELQTSVERAGLDPNDEDLIENLAGALLMGDSVRVQRLLGGR